MKCCASPSSQWRRRSRPPPIRDCLKSAKAGSADSIARGTGSFSSTKLRSAPLGRPRTCAIMWKHLGTAQHKFLGRSENAVNDIVQLIIWTA